MNRQNQSRMLVLLMLSAAITPAFAEELLIAVASNFAAPMEEIIADFQAQTGHEVTLSLGATGRHYAQISNGAPFDAFFAADEERPRLLEEAGLAVAGSRFTYATGRLALWSPDANLVDAEARVLESGEFRFLAVANPRLAPYGLAAKQVLQQRGLWQSLEQAGKIVRGENIAQTYQFVQSGNAQLGFVAWSQIKSPAGMAAGSWWEVPEALHDPIAQQAVQLSEKPAVAEFMTYLRSEPALEVIRSYGYGVP